MRVLITGATGFVGRNLINSPFAEGITFYKAIRGTAASDACEIPLGQELWTESAIRRAIDISAPDLILHCAGVVFDGNVTDLFSANVMLAANIFNAVATAASAPRVLVIGSAAEYGLVPEAMLPVTEIFPCSPHTIYGISKYTQTLLSIAAAHRDIRSLVIRMFNPIGSGMPPSLSLPSFARRIAAASYGDVIKIGNTAVSRDFIDIKEACRVILGLARIDNWPWQIINLCSGAAYSLESLLKIMIYHSGKDLKTQTDFSLTRSSEMRILYGSVDRLMRLGLEPRSPHLTELVKDVLAGAGGLSGPNAGPVISGSSPG